MNETVKTIKSRRSIRAYREEQIKKEELQAILEAGIYAPSAVNQQSWHFTVIQNTQLLAELSEQTKQLFLASEHARYQKMARNENFQLFYNAPTLIIVSGDEQAIAPQADCAAATQNILLAAESLGIGSCWINMVMSLLHSEEGEPWIDKLGIPTGYRPLYSIALGYKQKDTHTIPARKMDCINYL
ncbi:MAG: nitroreductase family protein [Firmicutes bacterium]|nr:nitroreductase family protein [Bacillota bacterium]